jgi:alkylation response protein AidB-like acyl-CoA dehydrogenase
MRVSLRERIFWPDMRTAALEAARRIADDLLFPAATGTDAATLVPKSNLDPLADAGLYGLHVPTEYGGLGASAAELYEAVEIIAGGCLTTAFVWTQHLGVVWAIISSRRDDLRDTWLRPLARGEIRGGLSLSAIRPGPPSLRAREVNGAWVLSGTSPWVTGWGVTDVVYTGARTDDGRMVWSLIDAEPCSSLRVQTLDLIAANASGTVELAFDDHPVQADRIVSVFPYREPPPHDGGGRHNGSLALGIASRCCRLIGETPLRDEVDTCRERLDDADELGMAAARAAACELAVRCAAALVVHTGSTAAIAGGHAERLMREATFLLVFGSRPAIRMALADRLLRR